MYIWLCLIFNNLIIMGYLVILIFFFGSSEFCFIYTYMCMYMYMFEHVCVYETKFRTSKGRKLILSVIPEFKVITKKDLKRHIILLYIFRRLCDFFLRFHFFDKRNHTMNTAL